MKNYLLTSFCGIYLFLNLAMSNNILQWNCSIKANFEELTLNQQTETSSSISTRNFSQRFRQISNKIPLLLPQKFY